MSHCSSSIDCFSTIVDVTDHVPVDDNPAYITMKKITLSKNSAYETVTVASHYETVDITY